MILKGSLKVFLGTESSFFGLMPYFCQVRMGSFPGIWPASAGIARTEDIRQKIYGEECQRVWS